MSYKGVDVDALRALVTQMRASQVDFDHVVKSLTAEMRVLPWVGPDRDHFENEWNLHVARLTSVCAALERAARDAAQHADHQEQVSRSSGSGSW